MNPSTSLQNAVKNKVYRLHRKTPEYQHYRYRQGQLSALASPRRTARYERIPPDGFDMAALEVTLCGGTPPPPNGGPPRTERSPLPCGHRSLLFLFCLPDSLIENTVQLALDKNKPAPTEVPVGAGFAASEQFHMFRYSRFTFSYACSLPRLPLPVQCLPE